MGLDTGERGRNVGEGNVPDSGEPAAGAGGRVARGTAVRAVGELVAKIASLAFFVVLARKLGEDRFGDYVFGISLSTVVLSAAAFGSDELLTREVARDHARGRALFSNILALKVMMLFALLGVLALIVWAGGYSSTTRIAVMILSVGISLEVLIKTPFAMMQGHEKMKYIAWCLVVQRSFLALIGVVILLDGGGLVATAFAMPLAAGIAYAMATWLLLKHVDRPALVIDRREWWGIIKAGAPLGFAVLLFTLLLKLDVALLSFLKGGNNADVGQYGAAFRLIESTMFVSWAFGGAMLPWLSRDGKHRAVSLNRGYELSLKVLVAMLLPVGVGIAVYAEPLINLIYGAGYQDAVLPLRLLGITTVLFGVNSMGAILMIARDRPGDFAIPAMIAIAQNVTFNFILIPPLGALGAAINAVVSGIVLAGFTLHRVGRHFGSVSISRVLVAPFVAAAAMAGTAALTGFSLDPIGVLVSTLAYVGTFVAIERLAYPGDFSFFRNVLLNAVGRRGADDAQGPVHPLPSELDL